MLSDSGLVACTMQGRSHTTRHYYLLNIIRNVVHNIFRKSLWLLPTESDNCWVGFAPTRKTRLITAHVRGGITAPLLLGQLEVQ